MSEIAMGVEGPGEAPLTVVLAHGAGAGMDSPFMVDVARELAARGWRVVRFDFPYMARARAEGRRCPPDPRARLLACWHEVIETLGGAQRLVVGGKSMGGRMASIVATEAAVAGLLVFGYPFHPPGKPERTRIDHLRDLRCPGLIVQGERDPFGRPEEVSGYDLPGSIRVDWVPDGDHGFKPRKRSGHTEEGNLAWALERADVFLKGLASQGS